MKPELIAELTALGLQPENELHGTKTEGSYTTVTRFTSRYLSNVPEAALELIVNSLVDSNKSPKPKTIVKFINNLPKEFGYKAKMHSKKKPKTKEVIQDRLRDLISEGAFNPLTRPDRMLGIMQFNDLPEDKKHEIVAKVFGGKRVDGISGFLAKADEIISMMEEDESLPMADTMKKFRETQPIITEALKEIDDNKKARFMNMKEEDRQELLKHISGDNKPESIHDYLAEVKKIINGLPDEVEAVK